jgi:hypothetical protein
MHFLIYNPVTHYVGRLEVGHTGTAIPRPSFGVVMHFRVLNIKVSIIGIIDFSTILLQL